MDIGFIWNELKYEDVRAKHRVVFDEVVSVIEDVRRLEFNDPQGNADRFASVGATRSGRVLFVIQSDEDLPLFRIITAFDAPKEYRHEYERQIRH